MRAAATGGAAATGAATGPPAWTVHDAGGTEELPGPVARTAGGPPTGDAAVDEAADGVAATLALLADELGRSSYDDRGAPVVATVHFGRGYANAFWDGEQLVLGDGDGEVFGRFTRSPDVLAHELGHAVTEVAAGLVYEGQPGALNEHVSDVLAATLTQWRAGQLPGEADWLVGADLFLPGVAARGLRDMLAPGTAYDDPRLGADPQVGHLDDYVETTDDDGGVHLNSGIPNRAFAVAARATGVPLWRGLAPVWLAALTSGLDPRTGFAGFAAATLAAAGPHADAVAEGWRTVGVEPAAGAGAAGPGAAPVGEPGGDPAVVEVRRSGGFAGRRDAGRVDLAGGDPRSGEVAAIVRRCGAAELTGARRAQRQPDRFVYAFVVDGTETVLPEQALSADLRRLARLVLGEGDR